MGLVRSLVVAAFPLAALGAGTWFALGRPPRTAVESALTAAWGAHRSSLPGFPTPVVRPEAHAPAAPLPPPTRALDARRDEPPPEAPVDADAFPRTNPSADMEKAWLTAEGPEPYAGDGRRYVTLTFDDGPTGVVTPRILDVLAKHHVRAAFFMLGGSLEGESHRAEAARAAARSVAEAGHVIGNHGYEHVVLPNLGPAKAASDIDRSANAIERATGTKPVLFRPPYGITDPPLAAHLRARGDELLLWSIDGGDIQRKDEAGVLGTYEHQLTFRGGGIVLLHDVRGPSVRELEKLLRYLEAKRWDPEHPGRPGYVVVDLPTYLRLAALRPQPFPTRFALDRSRIDGWKKLHPDPAGADPGGEG